tara:strand:- start:372 stop:929 length:558 start_codon:yes stop_codon:yes gene_type:complete
MSETDKTIGTGNPLEHADFALPPLHIPDGKGGCYKTELVLERSKEKVVKIHWWHGPDPRRDPHNHPWPFKSTILSGGYTETRYHNIGDTDILSYGVATNTRTYRAGDVNDMPASVFHTVGEVLPGTVTRMETGPIVEGGDWGYLIKGKYVSAKDDVVYQNSNFFGELCAINPHKRAAEGREVRDE